MAWYKVLLTHEDWSESVLVCPNCGNAFLHHGKITVFDRIGSEYEDNPKTLVVDVDCSKVTTQVKPSAKTDNPSSRRDGLTIQFWCENCNFDNLRLHIYQHKGNTFIEWADKEDETTKKVR